jgi:hypothetical protein
VPEPRKNDELSLFLEGEHSYEEEGVEAMELTVDGKPAPTTVVYARRRKSLMLALQVVALGPNAASTINN